MICFQNLYLLQKKSIVYNKPGKRFDLNFPQKFKTNNAVLTLSSSFSFNDTIKLKNNRQKISTQMDDIILKLQSTQTDSDFLKFCFLNRDTISYVFLYQITALKLKGEETQSDNVRANKIKELRKKILENIQLIDQPITQSLIISEKVVKEILTLDDQTSNITSIVKNEKINISSLWIVLTAAISAWQKKISFGEDDNSRSTLEKLLKTKKTIFSNENFQSSLSKELLFLDSYKFSGKESKNVDFEIGFLDGLKLLICILEKLPKSSYGVLLDEVSECYGNIVREKLGLEKVSLVQNAIQFNPKKISTDSRLVNIKDQSFKN